MRRRRCSRSPTSRCPTSPTTTTTTARSPGCQCFISRTGYTGEDGFELYCRWKDTPTIWEALLKAGALPIGLGARDSLRLEMGYALYGHEIDRQHHAARGRPRLDREAQQGRAVHRGRCARRAEGPRRHPEAGGLQAPRPRHRAAGLSGVVPGQAGGPGAERHAEPVAQRRRSARRSCRPTRRRSGPSSRSSAGASGSRPRWWSGRSGRMAR